VIENVTFDPSDLPGAARLVLDAWSRNLVVILHPSRKPDDVRAMYDALLPLVGTPHRLAEDARVADRSAQRNGELWFEVRFDPDYPDRYRHSKNAQPLHTDGSYIPSFPNATLMCCVTSAGEGGETTFIGGPELVAALEAENPQLLDKLWRTEVPHARSGDARSHTVLRRGAQGELLLNWNYYCVDAAATEVSALREELFAFLRDSPGVKRATHAVKLAPGDGVVWKDDRLLHGRNAFSASMASERFLWKCAVDVGVFA